LFLQPKAAHIKLEERFIPTDEQIATWKQNKYEKKIEYNSSKNS
jgi:hypothetical protein